MIAHLKMEKNKKIKILTLTMPFVLLFMIYFISLLLSEYIYKDVYLTDKLARYGYIPSILCAIAILKFYRTSTQLFYLKKFEGEINRKYPNGLDEEVFFKESELKFPRYKIYLYNNDLFMMGPEYHIIGLDSIKAICFKALSYRGYYRWAIVFNTKERSRTIEINDSTDIADEKIFNELIEPMGIFIKQNFKGIEFKGIIDD